MIHFGKLLSAESEFVCLKVNCKQQISYGFFVTVIAKLAMLTFKTDVVFKSC